MSTYWMDQEQILSQIKKEKNFSEKALEARRASLYERQRLYLERNWSPEKMVYIQYIYSQCRQLMSVMYSDEIQVEFIGYDIGDKDAAEKRSKIADFDFREMEKEIHDYVKLRDRILMGVGIEVFDWWDSERNVPIISTRSPLTWLPDPQGWLSADKFRRHGFLGKITEEDAKNMGFKKISKLKDTRKREYEGNPYDDVDSDTPEPQDQERTEYNVYHHYTKIKWDIYLVSTDDACTTIFRMSKISEVFGKNVFPVVLSYFSPLRDDPFGVSLVDLTEDKQKQISKLLNLAVKKAQRNTQWPLKIFNNSAIDDAQLESIKQTEEDPVFINAKIPAGQSVSDIVTDVPTESWPVDALNIIQQLDFQSRISSGIDPINMGIQTPGSITATEAQQLQSNANLIFSLTNSIGFRGEKDFRRKWYLLYKENFDKEKVIRISVADDISFLRIRKQDINTKYDPDIKISSKIQNKKQKQEKLQSYAAFLPYVLQQGGYAAKKWLRKLFEMIDFDPELVRILVPPTADEIKAKSEVLLLNNNDPIPVENMDINDDQDAYIAIYKTAIDTPAKFAAIQARLDLKQEKERRMNRQDQQMRWVQSQINATQAQMTARATQNRDIESAADVA